MRVGVSLYGVVHFFGAMEQGDSGGEKGMFMWIAHDVFPVVFDAFDLSAQCAAHGVEGNKFVRRGFFVGAVFVGFVGLGILLELPVDVFAVPEVVNALLNAFLGRGHFCVNVEVVFLEHFSIAISWSKEAVRVTLTRAAAVRCMTFA